MIGVVLSLGWLVYVATRPPMPLLGREAGTQVFRDLDENPGDETFPGIAVLRLDGGLFFATAEALEDRVRALIAGRRRRLRARARPRGRQLRRLPGRREADARSSSWPKPTASRCGSRGSSRRCSPCCEADGIVDRIGADRIHGNVHRAVRTQLEA